MNFVMLSYAWDARGVRKPKDPPLHIYKGEAGKTSTLCGRKVPTQAYGWFATGCPLDDPAFPFGPICPRCRRKADA